MLSLSWAHTAVAGDHLCTDFYGVSRADTVVPSLRGGPRGVGTEPARGKR
jgi:hypothetical protein